LAPEPKQFETISGAGHNGTVEIGKRPYFSRIARFLDEVAPKERAVELRFTNILLRKPSLSLAKQEALAGKQQAMLRNNGARDRDRTGDPQLGNVTEAA